jgi:hypothetical protein
MEALSLPERITAISNPKSSTGRVDVFTRLICDGSHEFDKVPVDIRAIYGLKFLLEHFQSLSVREHV